MSSRFEYVRFLPEVGSGIANQVAEIENLDKVIRTTQSRRRQAMAKLADDIKANWRAEDIATAKRQAFDARKAERKKA